MCESGDMRSLSLREGALGKPSVEGQHKWTPTDTQSHAVTPTFVSHPPTFAVVPVAGAHAHGEAVGFGSCWDSWFGIQRRTVWAIGARCPAPR